MFSTRWGAPLGALAYEAVARAASRLFQSVRGVRAVYVTGSFAGRDRGFRPGYSDLDLVVVLEPLDLDAELRAREELDVWVRRLRRSAPIVQTVDAIELGDLALLERFGDAWAEDLTGRWRLVAGKKVALGRTVRDANEMTLLRSTAALRSWFKRASRLLAIPPAEVCERDVRAAERLAVESLRVTTDASPQAAAKALAEGACPIPELARDPVFARVRGASTLAARRDRALEQALTLLDHEASRATKAWRSEAGTTRGSYEAPRSPGVLRVRDAAIGAGFETVATCARDAATTDHALLVVAKEGIGAAELLERAARVLRESPSLDESGFRWAPLPVFLTPNLLRAAYLFDPAPFAYESLMHAGAWLAGRAPLVAPSATEQACVVRSTRVMHLSRARSRRFHARTDAEALARLAIETHALVGPLNAREAEGAIRFGAGAPPMTTPERELLDRLREELDVVRRDLSPF